MKKEYFIMVIIFISVTMTLFSIILKQENYIQEKDDNSNINEGNHNLLESNNKSINNSKEQCIVAISFDDGYIEQYHTMIWLEDKEIPSTIYIPTNLTGKMFEDYYEIIDWEKIQNLEDLNYADIQTHGSNHIYLDKYSYKEIIDDINNSIIEYKKHGIDIDVFATPYGSGNKFLENISKDIITPRTTGWDFTKKNTFYTALPVTEENYNDFKNSYVFNKLGESKYPLIIIFHRVTNDVNNTSVPFRNNIDITFDTFKDFISLIKEKNCKIIFEKDVGDYINE